VRGRGFERLCKWVLENTPKYAEKLERVWLWDEWSGRWALDAGIDPVAEDRDGGLWAVQAKHYGPRTRSRGRHRLVPVGVVAGGAHLSGC
jgi:predicted helicase